MTLGRFIINIMTLVPGAFKLWPLCITYGKALQSLFCTLLLAILRDALSYSLWVILHRVATNVILSDVVTITALMISVAQGNFICCQ